ncbi:MAG: DUF2085 domain-containing protein [Anaerolineales bacterium]|nr:DUF2085 domain-containing protein [Anaerolineales bacterium]MCX7609392.1 DUF2085 domain-containing protein [Anaerolineales bacterium]MDW8227197.1 DUF2085 domain-containing protein [Anaerolineales bacterium]
MYSRSGCHLCEEAERELHALQETIPHKLTIIDIESDPALLRRFLPDIPVIEVGPYRLKAPFTRAELQMTLGAAADRLAQLERLDAAAYRKSATLAAHITRADRISYWISRHYLFVLNLFLFLYVGLPFLAPVFKVIGWDVPASLVYRIYRPLCHQWAFRSWFLFGEQAYYPHAAAGLSDVMSFEEATGITDANDPSRYQARLFEGTPRLGYKVALCQRDVAIWGAMLLFGLVYALTGRRLPALHWMLWLFLGIAPAALDGLSQLISQIPGNFLSPYLPYRESTPLLRTVTGFLFGWMTAWMVFPTLEETMSESRRVLAKKFAVLRS